PSAFVMIDAFPLTPNGKLDHTALPQPDYTAETTARGPRTPKEEILCDLFTEELDLPYVGIDDEFFHLGVHSLLAAQLLTLIIEGFGVGLCIGTLFESPAAAGLDERLEAGDNSRAHDELLAVRTSG